MATKYLTNLAKALLGQSFDDLTAREQHVIEAIASGETVAENTNQVFRDQTTFWQRLAVVVSLPRESVGLPSDFVVTPY